LQKVQILLNEIDGKKSDGMVLNPPVVPAIFGMNFQAVSVGQKLVDSHNPSVTGGYVDPTLTSPPGQIGVPSPALLSEIEFVDAAMGKLVNELKTKGLYQSTTIIIGAKHGQSPIDIRRLNKINTSNGRPTKLLSALIAGSSEDDISILWLKDSANTNTAVNTLEMNAGAVDFGTIYAGFSMKLLFGNPAMDPRVPDIVVQPNVGVIYTGSTSKVAEHGGFAEDDTHAMLMVSNPRLSPKTVTSPVENAQVAPTILELLGLNPNELDGVRLEGTQVLPGLRSPQD
jgi:arylsulfatase A-like enzyme